jgi:hypothetical protein
MLGNLDRSSCRMEQSLKYCAEPVTGSGCRGRFHPGRSGLGSGLPAASHRVLASVFHGGRCGFPGRTASSTPVIYYEYS